MNKIPHMMFRYISVTHFKDSPSAPATPDYAAAASATAAAQRINQITPYGNLTYTHDPSAGEDDGWTANTTLSDAQQQLLNSNNQISQGLANTANQGLGYVQQALSNPITAANLPASQVNAGQTGQDALMARYQPQIDQSNAALESKLANQGITTGSEAYNNAERVQNQGTNDLRSQAALNGIQVGEDAQNQQLSLQTALQNEPINVLNAVRSGSQVTNPTFTSTAGQGANQLAAAQATGTANQGIYNTEVGATNSANSGLASIAGAGLGALGAAGKLSTFI